LIVHMVFATKCRDLQIDYSIEKKVYAFLKTELQKMNCVVIAINGMPDHVHLLFSGRRDLSSSEIAKQIKGASSFWINQQKLTAEKFAWQRGYAVFSVSHHQVGVVTHYIQNQKKHHAKVEEMEADYWKKIVSKAS